MSVNRLRPTSDGRAANIAYDKKKASTAIALNELLTLDTNGQLIPAVTASVKVVGVSLSTVLATDDNYASTDMIQYDAALDGDEFIMDVDDAATVGFVEGVERAIVNSKTIKAAAPGENEGRLVRVKRVLTNEDKAVVELITNADSESIPVLLDAVQQAINANGAISLTTFNTAITSVAVSGVSFTLADGTVVGQIKRIQLVVDGADATVTFNTNATIVFADIGDVAELIWNGVDWIPVALYNMADGTTAPVYTPAS